MLEVTAPSVGLLSPFAGTVVMTALCGRCVSHLTSLRQDRRSGHRAYSFWPAHCELDRSLSATYARLCESLSTAGPMSEQSLAYINLTLQTSYIYLHEAAVNRGAEAGLAPTFIIDSELRCKTAAMEIANIARLASPRGMLPTVSGLFPFLVSPKTPRARDPLTKPYRHAMRRDVGRAEKTCGRSCFSCDQ